jgi:membrane protease YdiL (CAAX protease family)
MIRLLKKLFWDNWKAIDVEADRDRAANPRAYDVRPLVVLVAVCVALSLQEYVGQGFVFADWFPDYARGEYAQLKRFAWWSGWRFIGYVIVPIGVIWMLPGERVRDYFISFKGITKKLPIYLGLYLIVLPAVLIASRTQSFYLTYPFYKWANRSAFDFWVWEALYALQFVSLEFFFRGFMLKALRERLGSAAIFVMVVPYCMIHFGKPMAETFGAIIAGIVLGTLAMRTRSIWGGVFVHVAVALTMDALALSHCPPPEARVPCSSH